VLGSFASNVLDGFASTVLGDSRGNVLWSFARQRARCTFQRALRLRFQRAVHAAQNVLLGVARGMRRAYEIACLCATFEICCVGSFPTN
jgi:hypothetical protein